MGRNVGTVWNRARGPWRDVGKGRVDPPLKMERMGPVRSLLLTVLAAALCGCEGRILLPGDNPPIQFGSGGGGGGTNIGGVGGGGGEVVLPDEPVASSRVPRLSHAEYENTVKDLLALPAPSGITSTFVGDTTSGTFSNVGGELSVNSDLWTDYQRAAESLAATATASTATLTALAGGVWPTTADAQLNAVGRRVFRRPLTSAERTAYKKLYDEGPADYPAVTAINASVRVVLEAMLQSPNFLYRPELSTVVAAGKVPLSQTELATRLSYALWQSMPDEALLQAAEGGQLVGAGFTAQVDRLIADETRMRASSTWFHDQLLETARYADITRSTTLFPEYSKPLTAAMKEETQRYVNAVVFDEKGGLDRLLTAPYSFINPDLAKVYGLTVGPGFSKVTFPPGKRAGLLTQPGFLAAMASSTDPDAIHRGVFVNHKILCANLPPPPMMVPALPAQDPNAPPKTMRTRITEFTGAGTCGSGCHSTMINPIGFAFEHYDALGRWRDTDKGLPVDAKDTYAFGTLKRTYDGALELGQTISEEPQAHVCYASKWLEFLFARKLDAKDKALIARVGKASHDQKTSVQQVIRTLVTSDSFMSRGVAP